MNHLFFRFLLAPALPLIFISCNNEKTEKVNAGEKPAVFAVPTPAYYIKTFEVKNEAGISQGWGYDIYIDSVRTIHQQIIPAVPGIQYFKTEKAATITGNYAIKKIQSSGSFPTLSVKELDSLGVTK